MTITLPKLPSPRYRDTVSRNTPYWDIYKKRCKIINQLTADNILLSDCMTYCDYKRDDYALKIAEVVAKIHSDSCADNIITLATCDTTTLGQWIQALTHIMRYAYSQQNIAAYGKIRYYINKTTPLLDKVRNYLHSTN